MLNLLSSDEYFYAGAQTLMNYPECGNQEFWIFQFLEPLRSIYAWEITTVSLGLTPKKMNPLHNSKLSAYGGYQMIHLPGKPTLETYLSRWLAGLFVYYGWNPSETPSKRAEIACKGLSYFKSRVTHIAPEHRLDTLLNAFHAAETAILESACLDDGESLRVYLKETESPVSLDLRKVLNLIEQTFGNTDEARLERATDMAKAS